MWCLSSSQTPGTFLSGPDCMEMDLRSQIRLSGSNRQRVSQYSGFVCSIFTTQICLWGDGRVIRSSRLSCYPSLPLKTITETFSSINMLIPGWAAWWLWWYDWHTTGLPVSGHTDLITLENYYLNKRTPYHIGSSRRGGSTLLSIKKFTDYFYYSRCQKLLLVIFCSVE